MKNWKEELKKCFPPTNNALICPTCHMAYCNQQGMNLQCPQWLSTSKQCNGVLMSPMMYAQKQVKKLTSEVEQDAYKRGLEDKEKVKQEGVKEGAMMALDIIATWQGWEESREFYLEKIQQELNKL